jgi:uncharacterized protein (TIGR00299 family) protein
MRIAYFDAASGISGDMTIGALLDAGAPKIDLSTLTAALSALEVDGYRLTFDRVKVGALVAGSFAVVLDPKGPTHAHHHDHHHAGHVEAHTQARGTSAGVDLALSSHYPGHGPSRNWPAIRALIESAGGRGLGAGVVERALTVFEALAKAEAAVHGIGIEEVHFHEVGAVDAIVDIVGTAWCLDELGIERCFVGPLPGGKSGYIQSEHGPLPVPAPATLRLLEGFDVIPNDGEGELVTPTGAAILHALARPIRPLMTIAASGSGAGKKRWSDRPNILRVFIGESSVDTDREVVVIETDIDDMAPTVLAFSAEKIRAAGAIDVTISAVDMKKGRVGHRLTVLADPAHMESLARTILEETTSLGVRFRAMGRFVLPRRIEIVATPFGPVAVKVALRPSGRETAEPEFDDVARAALASGVPFATVREAALAAWTALAR